LITLTKKLPKIDGINLDEGVRKFSGNLEIYLRVINSFIKNIPEKLLEVSNPTEQNLEDYRITVHGIKGSCYGINATGLGDKAAALEKFAKDGELAEIQTLNSQFLSLAEKLIADLKGFVESEEAVKPAKVKIAKPNIELLQTILTAAQDYDNDEIQNAIDELDEFDYEQDGDLISQIKQSVDSFNYEAVSVAVENYLKTQK
jgi:HPt (histidine-containing phosphotransfer) domain-containing protein